MKNKRETEEMRNRGDEEQERDRGEERAVANEASEKEAIYQTHKRARLPKCPHCSLHS
jgi:hypothetical protein